MKIFKFLFFLFLVGFLLLMTYQKFGILGVLGLLFICSSLWLIEFMHIKDTGEKPEWSKKLAEKSDISKDGGGYSHFFDGGFDGGGGD